MMRHLESRRRRLALLAASACVLFVAVSTAGTLDAPYAPNDWSFSHVFLANLALESGEMPMNWKLLSDNEFAQTRGAFQETTGMTRMTYYANTAWHFWNGLPLHPSFVATGSALTGLAPESFIRIPIAGLAVVLLTFAAALVIGARTPGDPMLLAAAPFLVAIACAPLALDMRVVMPSTTLVIIVLLLYGMTRRAILDDNRTFWVALAPLALLPLWYYTMAYFALILFASFLAFHALARFRRGLMRPRALVPLHAALLVPVFLGVLLSTTGTLDSHINMAQIMMDGTRDESGGADYTTNLNRVAWRSALLYSELALLFLPIGLLGLTVIADLLRGRAVDNGRILVSQWGAAGLLFALILVPTVGISFVNRSIIYLAPVAVLAAVVFLGARWRSKAVRGVFVGAVCFALVTTPLLVVTAMPSYGSSDAAGFTWMEAHVPNDALVYSGLEVSSVLLSHHGFTHVNSFQPSLPVLDDFWYGSDPERIVPYLGTFHYFVLREEFRTQGFEEFGPARQPISEAAYEKFSHSRDLHRVYDNGKLQVFHVGLHPDRVMGSRP